MDSKRRGQNGEKGIADTNLYDICLRINAKRCFTLNKITYAE